MRGQFSGRYAFARHPLRTSRTDGCSRRGTKAEAMRGTAARGSATVELVVIVPFILVLLAAVWDLREHIGYRTELAREMYVVAEAIADDPEGAQPFELAVAQAEARLREFGASGVIRAAVVVRGTERPGGEACLDGEWCLPMVTATWPPAVENPVGTWSRSDDNVCATGGSNELPAPAGHFASGQRVLPNEGADPDGDGSGVPPSEDAWISRNLRDTEWWVVVDTCVDPQPGLFIGHLANLGETMLDVSFALRRRAVWGSIHDLADCEWC